MDGQTTEPAPPPLVPMDHAERMETARKLSAYQLGDSTWADMMVDAYLNPGSVPPEEMGL